MCVTARLWLQDDFNFEPCSMTVLEGLKYYHNFFTLLSINSELGFSLFFFFFKFCSNFGWINWTFNIFETIRLPSDGLVQSDGSQISQAH